MNKKNILKNLIYFLICLLGAIFLFNKVVPHSNSELDKQDFLREAHLSWNYVALGDSLTEGVGDSSNQGGFVPLLSFEIEDAYGVSLKQKNFGVAGNTSKQILKRMQEDGEIPKALENANVMTLTVGGNDVMAVIRKNFTNLTVKSFEEPRETYQKRLKQIIELARVNNPNLPIYVLGIYNPFYLSFPDMTVMQDIIDDWNAATEETVEAIDKVYFVPINDLLYKGLDGQKGVDLEGTTGSTQNDVLYEEDNFHPNYTGYRIMANAVMEKISETQSDWNEN